MFNGKGEDRFSVVANPARLFTAHVGVGACGLPASWELL